MIHANVNRGSSLKDITECLTEMFSRRVAIYGHSWSDMVMKQVGIAELKAKLSEYLRIIQGGETIAVLDRNRAVAHIVPIRERPGLLIRKPAPGSPKPNRVALPKPSPQSIDIVELLFEERQNHR